MKAWKLLCVLLLAINVKGQNLESVISINEVGLKATFSTYDFDDDGNLYVALNLGYTEKEDSTKFVIVNYPKGRDTFYYQYKKRIYLLKLSLKGMLTKQRIDIEDGLDYDFFHDVTLLKINGNRLHFVIPKISRTNTQNKINGYLLKTFNDSSNHYFNVITTDLSYRIKSIYSYGYLENDLRSNLLRISDSSLLNIYEISVFGNFSQNADGQYLVEKSGKLKYLGNNYDNRYFFNESFLSDYSKADSTCQVSKLTFNNGVIKSTEISRFKMSSSLISTSKQSEKSIVLGDVSYGRYYTDNRARYFGSNFFFEQTKLSDFYDIPDSAEFSVSSIFIGFKPDIGIYHWFSGTTFHDFSIEGSDSVSFFASVDPTGFQYQFRPDTINKKPFSESFYQLALFNVKYDGSLSHKYIANIRNRIGYSYGIDESSFSMHNGSVYFLNNSSDFPDTVTIDSVTGFTYNPNKAIVRYQLFSPPKYVPEILFTQKDCNSGLLEFKSKDAEHYTVLISNDTIRDFPKAGENYNYSPNYLLAPKLANNVKILYQGPDTSFQITNLVSDRQYFIAVVPGNGLQSSTLYNPDSTAFVEFSLASSRSKPNIYPVRDTSLCTYDSIYAEALTDLAARWMDGKVDKRRFVKQKNAFSYTIKDSLNCIVSSDTVNVEFKPTPKIDSIFTLQKEPFCLGDTISIDLATNGNIVWSNGSRGRTIKTDSSGVYKVGVSNSFGCSDSAQIFIKFNPRPYFNFNGDSIIAIDGEAEIDFKTNASKTDFIYKNDTLADLDFWFDETATLKANAFYNSGCFVSDTLLIKALQSQADIFPNAFSPNGDGLNDEWYFIHPDTAGTLIIFDRWGGKVFQGTNKWDGKKHGEILPMGAYRYTFIPKNGEVRRGLIFLVK